MTPHDSRLTSAQCHPGDLARLAPMADRLQGRQRMAAAT